MIYPGAAGQRSEEAQVLVFIINILTVIVTKTQKYWVFYSD